MLEQLSELGKRYLGMKWMIDTEPKIEFIPMTLKPEVTEHHFLQ